MRRLWRDEIRWLLAAAALLAGPMLLVIWTAR